MENDIRRPQTTLEERRVLDAAIEAGHILLQNGAEISCVEKTVERIHRDMTCEFFKCDIHIQSILTACASKLHFGEQMFTFAEKNKYLTVRRPKFSYPCINKPQFVNALNPQPCD